jgi:hypothetical protein
MHSLEYIPKIEDPNTGLESLYETIEIHQSD